jgi:CheY-like chemotaxis protein
LFGVRTFGEQVRIEIWDTGIGMHPDDIPTIFDEFKRLSDGVKTEKAGLGLGLSISKRICNLLGLELKTHSKPGVGSCFSVSLPRSDATPESLAQRSQKISNVLSKPLTGRTVLVIDNDKSILTGMAALLSGWGAKVITGERLKDATQACREHPEIQLALIDYHLDSENLGVDIITVLHALKSELVCALITADRSDEMFNQARAVGATVLHKPLKPAALRSFITQKLRRLPLPPSA